MSTSRRPVVCVQGLGFVGAAMVAAIASAHDGNGLPCFSVIGVDLPNDRGRRRAEAIGRGEMPFSCPDPKLADALVAAVRQGNLTTTTSDVAFENADIAVVDVHLDVDFATRKVSFDGLRKAIRSIALRMPPGGLIIVETTVPPGTCRNVLAPEIAAALKSRDLPDTAIHLAHSYERVMPGPDYLDSIVNYWRVYAGLTPEAADACQKFLEAVINTRAYPLTRLVDITASETAKILENTYRATTIALMDEWGRFGERAGIDMFEVIKAIRMRPTHSNMRQPGFGVGGYCLTKDPILALIASQEFFSGSEHDFPLSSLALRVNHDMPIAALDRLKTYFGGSISRRRVLLMGVAYRSEVDDTRYSPSEGFYRAAIAEGASVICHDPHVRHWEELGLTIPEALPDPATADAVLFAVDHAAYRQINFGAWFGTAKPVVFDANNVLLGDQRDLLRKAGVPLLSVGRGERQ